MLSSAPDTGQMIQDIELDENKFKFDEQDDVFPISNVLKQCETLLAIARSPTGAHVLQT